MSPFQSNLQDGERVLWQGQPYASDKLADYPGKHDLIARGFYAVSAIMTLVFFVGLDAGGQLLLSWSMLAFVGGPIVIGLIVRHIGRRRARAAQRATRYAVTTQNLLVATGEARVSYPITANTLAEVTPGKSGTDILRLSDGHVTAEPGDLVFAGDDALQAQAAIRQAKAGL